MGILSLILIKYIKPQLGLFYFNRKTKVKDIYVTLLESSCSVSIYDPYLTQKTDTNFVSNPFESVKKYDAINVDVAHNEFFKVFY